MQPGSIHTFYLYNAPTGLTGLLAWRLEDDDDNVVPTYEETINGINEYPAASGNYRVEVTLPLVGGEYKIVWHYTTVQVPEAFAVDGSGPHVPGTSTIPSAAEIRDWSNVEFAELGYPVPTSGNDRLDPLVSRAVSEFFGTTGVDPSALDPTDANLARRSLAVLVQNAIQRYVEYMAASGQHEIVETAADFDMLSAMSAGAYNETRRTMRAPVDLHPWPLLNRLLVMIVELSGASPGSEHVPGVAYPDYAWNVASYIMRSRFTHGNPHFVSETGVPSLVAGWGAVPGVG